MHAEGVSREIIVQEVDYPPVTGEPDLPGGRVSDVADDHARQDVPNKEPGYVGSTCSGYRISMNARIEKKKEWFLTLGSSRPTDVHQGGKQVIEERTLHDEA